MLTTEQMATLKSYILADAELSALNEIGAVQSVVDTINQRTIPVVGGVPRSFFAMWCGTTGLRAVIQDHADNTTSPLRSVCLTLLDFLQGGVAATLDLSDPANQQMLGVWVSAGALTQAQADDLTALATSEQPVFGRFVSIDDVAQAMKG